MRQLRKALLATFPAECFLNGSSIRESHRTFSIRPARGEQVVAAQLDHSAMNWPQGQPACDALFLCLIPARTELLVALVELKGKDVRHAMDQIRASTRALCNRPQALKQPHSESVSRAVRALGKNGHGKGVLGIIVSAEGLTLEQRERARMWKTERIIFWIRTGQVREINCQELVRQFPSS